MSQYDANKLKSYNQSFFTLSHFIHEVQKERAKSALFLGQKLSTDELQQHRNLVEQKRKEALTDFMELNPKEENLQLWDSAQKDLAELRSKVDEKMDPSESAKAFGRIVDKIIKIQVSFSRSVQFQSLQNRILSLALLTTAKEYAGRLRANVINILNKNQPLTSAQLITVNNLKGEIISNMESQALILSEKGFQEVAKFKENADWKQVNNTVDHIIEKSAEGNYGRDPNDFYKSITAAIDAFLVITDGESTHFAEELTTIITNLKFRIEIIFALGGLTLCAALISMIIILRQLINQLKQIMARLSSISLELEKSGSKATDSSSRLSSGTTESAASLEETVASLEELTSMLKISSDNSEEASRLSLNGAEQAVEGEKATIELVQSMQGISESSNKIKDIVSVIDDIAFQINLLALNAAVEAARAGEQGRGFAVVADAVRTLAQKSGAAAKDIGGLISENVNKIESGVQIAAKSSDYLNSLSKIIKQISQINMEVASTNKEQNTGFNQISEAMNQLDASTQLNAAAAETVSQISSEMSHRAQDLGSVVDDLSKLVIGKKTS